MFNDLINQWQIILASRSPRRQYLLKEVGIKFQVIIRDVEEVWPPELFREEIPCYLCELKAKAFSPEELPGKTIVITADTVVLLHDQIVGKPVDRNDAIQILKRLSGKKHEVITGVCIKSSRKQTVFHVESDVYFREFSEKEIEWYVDRFQPYDKAGAYGIQEWIGYVGIEKINGSFFNVMGLPTQRLYLELCKFIKDDDINGQ
jgi:septum formation protein